METAETIRSDLCSSKSHSVGLYCTFEGVDEVFTLGGNLDKNCELFAL